jgi:hypothetical protein
MVQMREMELGEERGKKKWERGEGFFVVIVVVFACQSSMCLSHGPDGP